MIVDRLETELEEFFKNQAGIGRNCIAISFRKFSTGRWKKTSYTYLVWTGNRSNLWCFDLRSPRWSGRTQLNTISSLIQYSDSILNRKKKEQSRAVSWLLYYLTVARRNCSSNSIHYLTCDVYTNGGQTFLLFCKSIPVPPRGVLVCLSTLFLQINPRRRHWHITTIIIFVPFLSFSAISNTRVSTFYFFLCLQALIEGGCWLAWEPVN